MKKICTQCHIEKELTDFHKEKTSKFGVRSNCKLCKMAKQKLWKENLSEEKKEIRGKYMKEFLKKYYIKNKIKHNANGRKYYFENMKAMKEVMKSYYLNNSEKIISKVLLWQKENPERVREKNRNWAKIHPEVSKKYRDTYPHFCVWRGLLSRCLKQFNKPKNGKTIEILGYSPEELKIHLENQFQEGMSWDNHGKWHIDHKKPVSLFDKDTPISIVNALDNLQPLWAADNMSKHNKYYVSI